MPNAALYNLAVLQQRPQVCTMAVLGVYILRCVQHGSPAAETSGVNYCVCAYTHALFAGVHTGRKRMYKHVHVQSHTHVHTHTHTRVDPVLLK
jgi:hypothetical protein